MLDCSLLEPHPQGMHEVSQRIVRLDEAHGHGPDAGPEHAPEDCGCAHVHDRRERAPEALREAEEACRTQNLRLTPIRRQVLEALHATHRPVSAYELIDQLGPQNGRTLAPISVYRALDFLQEAGFVHRLESRNAFIACPAQHRPGDVVVFMICDQCGGVDETASDDLRKALGALAAQEAFVPRTQFIELAGTCAHCQG